MTTNQVIKTDEFEKIFIKLKPYETKEEAKKASIRFWFTPQMFKNSKSKSKVKINDENLECFYWGLIYKIRTTKTSRSGGNRNHHKSFIIVVSGRMISCSSKLSICVKVINHV